ncbi:MAG: hypothetical protein JNL82_17885 [Myxococcales bacterium]|jgi:hypothetical protein|nr:hypothetical protein [Myxococcales bacterium]
MSIARATARILRKQLRAHVAWLPLTNNFSLGDYGVFSGGVFVRMGNVRALGVDFTSESRDGGPFAFRSEGTREVRLSGGVAVEQFAAGDADATLRVAFTADESLLIRTHSLAVSEICELPPLAAALRRHPQWRQRYRVIHRLWTAADGIFLSSRGTDASIDFTGSADALTALQSGKGDLAVQVGARTNVGLDLVGATGPLALGLFRVRVIDGSPALVDFSAAAVADPDPFELDDPTDDDPDDDI